MKVKEVIGKFDKYLQQIGLEFSFIAIGGAALIVMDILTRETKDIDCIDPEIIEEVKEAAREFAENNLDLNLDSENWLNNGPILIIKNLPEGWRLRVQEIYKGAAITMMTLGREDLLKTKLFALVDRGIDLKDCLALNPTEDELVNSIAWVTEQDANPNWPEHVENVLEDLKGRLKNE